MPAFSDFSTNPDNNITIGGLAAGENAMSLSSVNNALRELAAQGRQLYDIVEPMTGGMPKAGGVFEGAISRKDYGGYYFAHDTGAVAPRIYILPEGSPAPTNAPAGSLLFYHAA